MSDLELERIYHSAAREDAQPFMTIRRLADTTAPPRVWHRYLAGDFKVIEHG